jgi:hypothetical protein
MTATAHLTEVDIKEIGRELDQIRDEVIASRGEGDARYIRRIIAVQRGLEVGGRTLLMVSILPPAWLAGTGALAISKILENMEIGHNVLHGQWDWMHDPEIHSTTWEWDSATPADMWKHSHNFVHHTYTNVLGKDRDSGTQRDAGQARAALAPRLPHPAAVQRDPRGVLRVGHRHLRRRTRTRLARRKELGRGADPTAPCPTQGRPPGGQGLRRVPAARRAVLAAHPARQRRRQHGPQRVVTHDHLLRSLPRGVRGLHRGRDGVVCLPEPKDEQKAVVFTVGVPCHVIDDLSPLHEPELFPELGLVGVEQLEDLLGRAAWEGAGREVSLPHLCGG